MKISKFLLLIFIFIHTSLQANIQNTKDLSALSVNSLYNLDNKQLKMTLTPFLIKNKHIMALSIIESVDNKVFIRFYRDKDKLIFNQLIPKNLQNLQNKWILNLTQ